MLFRSDEVHRLGGRLVNFVHDEWQTECPYDKATALQIASIQSHALTKVGKELKLKCPLAGSYTNDHGYTIGKNWYTTH